MKKRWTSGFVVAYVGELGNEVLGQRLAHGSLEFAVREKGRGKSSIGHAKQRLYLKCHRIQSANHCVVHRFIDSGLGLHLSVVNGVSQHRSELESPA